MSTSMGIDLVSGSIDASLAELDNRSRSPSRPSAGEIVVGPFSVLDFTAFTQPQESAGMGLREIPPVATPASAVAIAPPLTAPILASDVSPLSPGPFVIDSLAHMDDFLHWSDLLGITPDQPGFSSSLDGADIFDFHPTPQISALDSRLLGMDQESGAALAEEGEPGQTGQIPTPQQTPMKEPSASLDLLTDAPFLFKHFQDHVIPSMMAMPLGEKSPWKILNLSAAVVTYSDITFLGTRNPTHARLANLYGLLACAAIHLTLKPPNHMVHTAKDWSQIAAQTYQHAKDHMQTSLQLETATPKKAKYKDQLMAICGLIQFAVISGQQQHARCFMVDAERLLRLRGLPKRRISQKARLLHHVYTWLRIVGESTYVLHDYTPSTMFLEALDNQFRTPPGAVDLEATNDGNSRLDDFLRLDARHSDRDLNIDEPKDLEVGLHDIHLQDSRVFSETLYKQIYGIPETWLSLVSQTTRLANVMETFRTARSLGDGVSLEAWEALQRRSVRLENMICSFDLNRTQGPQPEPHDTSSKPHRHMLRALDASLMIFFYRRIRQVHPAILGGYVDNVISALHQFHAALPQDSYGGPGSAWPAFVAGCEATTSARREGILKCLEKAEMIRSFASFATAKNIMNELWRMQDEHLVRNRGDAFPTWIDVLKAGQSWPLLC
ncbi:hypothetical protein FE257_008995 [Aspergillus nanangensis]|uniref:C6 transcription factor n=1 Tax=Aspergillus nanangensis TaxID=2582783 RepID=A0AAD4CX09_ASPNN|nr:hypothetical protein FE257_008995 [Aspergillus nanangensis]